MNGASTDTPSTTTATLTTVQHIDAVDAFARTLYLRTKQIPSPAFDDVALAVRQLHLSLRHLRFEAADKESLLNQPDAPVYARQLQPIVQDCEFALKQLEAVLERHDAAPDRASIDALSDRIASVRAKIAHEEMSVAMFLDTVQLRPQHAPAAPLQQDDVSLDTIQQKVDAIATRLFSRPSNSSFSAGDDTLWQDFKSELEKEGFSPQVLHQHKVRPLALPHQHLHAASRSMRLTPVPGYPARLHSSARGPFPPSRISSTNHAGTFGI